MGSGPTSRPASTATTETAVRSASAEPTAQDILAKYLATKKTLSRVAVRGTTTECYTDTKMAGERAIRQIWRFLADGDRFEMTTELWFLGSRDKEATGPAETTNKMLWDGKTWYDMVESSPPDLKNCSVWVSDDKSQATGYLNVGDMFAPMWGRLLGDNGPIEDVVKNASAVMLRPRREKIGQSDCYVIDVKGPRGSHTIWFDPNHGYNIRRARYVKTGKDLWFGVTVDEKGQETDAPLAHDVPRPPAGGRVKCSFEYEATEFIRTGDTWAPRMGKWEMDILHQDGRLLTNRAQVERTEVIVNPDFAAMDRAFKPRIRNGTRVYRGENPNITRYWIDGEILENVLIFDMPDTPTSAGPADKACTKPATKPAK